MFLLWLMIGRKKFIKYMLTYIIVFIIPAYVALCGRWTNDNKCIM